MGKTASIGLRIDPKVKEAAERAAKDDNRSVASLIEKTLIDWLQGRGYLKKPK